MSGLTRDKLTQTTAYSVAHSGGPEGTPASSPRLQPRGNRQTSAPKELDELPCFHNLKIARLQPGERDLAKSLRDRCLGSKAKPRPLRFARAVSFLVALALASSAQAVIVFEKNNPQPLRGYLIDADEVRIIVEIPLPNGQRQERILPRSAISQMIETVDTDRLARLDPKHPEGYRDYAEELAEKRQDPEARETAMRLYLIAAYLRPNQLGRSCLLGMTRLAETVEEQRRFRAMAYLLDDQHDPTLLDVPDAPETVHVDALTDEQRELALLMFRMMRTGRKSELANLLNRPHVRKLLGAPGLLEDSESLRAAVRTGESLDEQQLRQVLIAEIRLLDPTSTQPAPSQGRQLPWSTVLAGGQTQPFPPLRLDTVTRFDPREQVFRNGRWVRPEEGIMTVIGEDASDDE